MLNTTLLNKSKLDIDGTWYQSYSLEQQPLENVQHE
jgi:hypothetical protein